MGELTLCAHVTYAGGMTTRWSGKERDFLFFFLYHLLLELRVFFSDDFPTSWIWLPKQTECGPCISMRCSSSKNRLLFQWPRCMAADREPKPTTGAEEQPSGTMVELLTAVTFLAHPLTWLLLRHTGQVCDWSLPFPLDLWQQSDSVQAGNWGN
jgi:hypothetical protein